MNRMTPNDMRIIHCTSQRRFTLCVPKYYSKIAKVVKRNTQTIRYRRIYFTEIKKKSSTIVCKLNSFLSPNGKMYDILETIHVVEQSSDLFFNIFPFIQLYLSSDRSIPFKLHKHVIEEFLRYIWIPVRNSRWPPLPLIGQDISDYNICSVGPILFILGEKWQQGIACVKTRLPNPKSGWPPWIQIG